LIREATASDLLALVSMCKDHHPASHWAPIPFDPSKALKAFESWLESDSATVLIGPGSFIVLGLLEPFFSHETIATEVMFYAPDGHGTALREAAIAWAKEHGATALLMGGEEPHRIEAKARWYRQGGFAPFSRTFMKVI
jgi:hypothetical protein